MTPADPHRYILGLRVDATTYRTAVRQILDWAAEGRGRIVCCASVHMVMECWDDACFRALVNGADLVTPDGMPLVWALRGLGVAGAVRVYGPNLMRMALAAAEEHGVAVGFYGGSPNTLSRLLAAIARRHQRLAVRYAWAPPFRPLAANEDAAVQAEIRRSGARLLFVGLGCPRQERWAAAHRELGTVILAVGAAFDFLAGVKPEAPRWVQQAGCEWLFRLAVEPKRLWKRYLKHNPRFAWFCGAQLLRARLGAGK